MLEMRKSRTGLLCCLSPSSYQLYDSTDFTKKREIKQSSGRGLSLSETVVREAHWSVGEALGRGREELVGDASTKELTLRESLTRDFTPIEAIARETLMTRVSKNEASPEEVSTKEVLTTQPREANKRRYCGGGS